MLDGSSRVRRSLACRGVLGVLLGGNLSEGDDVTGLEMGWSVALLRGHLAWLRVPRCWNSTDETPVVVLGIYTSPLDPHLFTLREAPCKAIG